MIQWLRALVALVEDASSIPSSHKVGHIAWNYSSRGPKASPGPQLRALPAHGAHTYM